MLTLLLAFQAATTHPATLWPEVAGMPLSQLQAVRPAARPIPEAEKSKWPQGCAFADEKSSFEGVTLDVCYEVQADRVTAVRLQSRLADHGGAAERVKPALVSAYGAPMLDGCGGFDRIFGHQGCNSIWKVGAITIKNERIKVAGKHIIILEYRAPAAVDANRL